LVNPLKQFMGETTQNGSFFAEQVKMQDSYDWAARLEPEPGEQLSENVNPTNLAS
jgi:hypothetical protein